MKNNKETRTCIGCKKKNNKKELIRMAFNENEITLDLKQKLQGRGMYICKNEECLNRIMKNKSFKPAINETIYNKIRGVILGG